MTITTSMGQWMYHQGYTLEQVLCYEAYLHASRQGRVFTCLRWRKGVRQGVAR